MKGIWRTSVNEEDELAEFCYRISDSRQFDYALTINWWKATKGDRGVIESAWGWIEKFDPTFKRIKLKNDRTIGGYL